MGVHIKPISLKKRFPYYTLPVFNEFTSKDTVNKHLMIKSSHLPITKVIASS